MDKTGICLQHIIKWGAMPLKTWLLFFMSALLFAGCINDDEPQEYVKEGDLVPEISIKLSDGTDYNSRETDGKATVLIFFNTTCPDCRRELPILQTQYEQSDPEKTRFVCISREEGKERVSAYWDETHLTMPWYADETRELFSMFAESGIPRIYVVSPNSRITSIHIGG